jgi:phosphoribosylformylglycinamidine cyclo-ligase
LAHITGGGVVENLPRILPNGTGAQIWRTMPEPPIFALIQREGHISTEEMFRVFNMGMGMLVVIDSTQADHALRLLGDDHAKAVGTANDSGKVEIDMNPA